TFLERQAALDEIDELHEVASSLGLNRPHVVGDEHQLPLHLDAAAHVPGRPLSASSGDEQGEPAADAGVSRAVAQRRKSSSVTMATSRPVSSTTGRHPILALSIR